MASFVIATAGRVIRVEGLVFVSSSDRLMFTFLGDYAGAQFFTGRDEGTHAREFEFEHFPNARLPDEDNENEKWREDVEYVGEQGTFETGICHESYNFCCPWNTHQQKETQDHFKPAIWETYVLKIKLKPCM